MVYSYIPKKKRKASIVLKYFMKHQHVDVNLTEQSIVVAFKKKIKT